MTSVPSVLPDPLLVPIPRRLEPVRLSVDLDPEVMKAEVLCWDIVDEWGYQSFPASDPPSNW